MPSLTDSDNPVTGACDYTTKSLPVVSYFRDRGSSGSAGGKLSSCGPRPESAMLCRWKQTMPMPDFQSLLKPLLNLASDWQEHSLHEAREYAARAYRLTPKELGERLPSGRFRFNNRVAWAKTYLIRAGLLESIQHAMWIRGMTSTRVVFRCTSYRFPIAP